MKAISVKEINKILSEHSIQWDDIKTMLKQKLKAKNCLTSLVNVGGLDFILFSEMANGRKDVYNVGGNNRGIYTTLEVKE